MSISIGKFVKTQRRKLGYSQEEFAKRVGMGLDLLRRLEQGKSNISMKNVNYILSFFSHELTVTAKKAEGSEQ